MVWLKPLFRCLVLSLALACGPIIAGELGAQPRLEVPVDCAIPVQCQIQFYVDARPGPGFADYRCGALSYDTHRGTDIRVRTMAEVKKGVPVLAAAAGTVVAVRDGEPDIEVSVLGRDKVTNKAGGNIVAIDHGQGWLSQYWHMRKGSIAVERGQTVKAGARLGMIGMSGDTSFPHLHFELSRNGSVIDPFTGAAPGALACGQSANALWSPAALRRLAYEDVTLVHAGLSNRTPTRIEVGDGKLIGDAASAAKRPLNIWYELVGLRRGDTIELALKDKSGAVLAQRERHFDRTVSYLFDVVSLDVGTRALPAGQYQVTLTVKSAADEKEALPFARLTRTIEVTLRP